VLAGTSNNNNLLGHLFDVNIADASFNINLKQKCQIIQNGISVFDGYLQLLNVNKLTPSQWNPDEFVEYEVAVRDDSGNFYSSLQEKLLQDLPYFDQYNHIYTFSAITATSAHTVNDGYTYILPFTSSNFYKVTDFAPAIYAKTYWDRIFLEAGYTYQWDSLTGCSFDKLVIPYNGDTLQVNNELYNFRAGFETGSSETLIVSATTIIIGQTDITSGGTVSRLIGIGSESEQLIYDDEVNSPNFDNGYYNPVTSVYTSDIVGTSEFKTKYKYELNLIAPVDCTFTKFLPSDPNPIIIIGLSTIVRKNLSDELTTLYYQNNIEAAEIDFAAGPLLINADTTPEVNSLFEINLGDEFRTYVKADYFFNGVWYYSGTTIQLSDEDIPYIEVTTRIDPTDYNSNYFKNILSGALNIGQLVEVPSFIPKQVKQKDFINAIVKMFNLYITPDKYEDNHLIIQTRDEYYDSGSVIDWTNKFAVDNDAQIEFLPDLQDKRLILSYKQDNDEWNKQYLLATGEVYGQVEYTFESEFTQSTKKIEPIFSPTPIIPNTTGLLVPAIMSQNPKTNIRILFYDGWKPGQWQFLTTGPLTTFDSYPRALHLDDPINPTLDINYAEPDYYGYSSYETVTNNNLYNKYWSRFVNQIETGKLLKGTFLLNEVDIHNLDLRSKVWVHDCYWNINRIIDYNPNGNGLTKVELISVDEGLKFAPIIWNRNDIDNPVIDIGPKNNWITNFVSWQDGQSKNEFGTTVVNTPVYGNNNIIQAGSQSSIIVGNNNNYSGKFGFVSGEENNVQGDNIYVFGGSGLTVTGDSQALFNVPVVATTISADTLFIGGSPTPIEAPVWVEGTGSVSGFAIKAVNDSTTDATGDYAVAEGFNTLASGEAAHAEGGATIASGLGAHAEGNSSTASGDNSHAEGFNTTASGTDSHAEGSGSVASGSASHAEGLGTIASGNFGSHAEGSSTQALGDSCHAQGIGSIAEGLASHAGGNESRTQIDGEIASSCTSLGSVGQTQFGTFDGFTATVNNTPTLLDFLSNNTGVNGWRPNFTASPTTAAAFRYLITCVNLATGDSRIITGEGMIKWITGTPTLVFASIPSVNGDLALLGVTATPVASGNGLQFQVTGLAATSLTWRVRVDYTF